MTRRGSQASEDPNLPDRRDRQVSTTGLLADAWWYIQERPLVVAVLIAAGLVVSGVDWVAIHDPIPSEGFQGVQDGHLSIAFGIVITVLSREAVPLSALVGLKLPWLGWALGLKALKILAVVGAGAYALARFLHVPLKTAAVLRYAAVVGVFHFGYGRLNFEGGAIIIAIPLLVVFFALTVRLFAVPGLLLTGMSIRSAVVGSWRLAYGRGWALVGVVIVVGAVNHALASIPLVGPIGSALVGVGHAGAVSAFLHRTRAEW